MKHLVVLAIFLTGVASGSAVFAYEYGDIAITEIMKDPKAVSDGCGEWFEVFNTTGVRIDLSGWSVCDLGTEGFVIEGDLWIDPGQYLVMGRNGDLEVNGGVHVDYEYGSAMWLGQSGDEIIIVDDTLAEIARVEYDDGEWPDPGGASMNLYNFILDMNIPAHWFGSHIETYGDGDFGSPGESCEPYFVVGLKDVPEYASPGETIEFDACLSQPTNYRREAKAWLAVEMDDLYEPIRETIRHFPALFAIDKPIDLSLPKGTPPGTWSLSINVGPDQVGYDDNWYSHSVEVTVEDVRP